MRLKAVEAQERNGFLACPPRGCMLAWREGEVSYFVHREARNLSRKRLRREVRILADVLEPVPAPPPGP